MIFFESYERPTLSYEIPKVEVVSQNQKSSFWLNNRKKISQQTEFIIEWREPYLPILN